MEQYSIDENEILFTKGENIGNDKGKGNPQENGESDGNDNHFLNAA